MRIISQDKTIDINYDEVILEVINSGVITANGINIGTYKTKYRAIEVMQKLKDTYIFSQSILDNNGEISTLKDVCNTSEDVIRVLKNVYYYEMPKE